MFLHGRSSGWIGHQSSPQTDAPALNTWALPSGKNWAISKATMAASIRDKISDAATRNGKCTEGDINSVFQVSRLFGITLPSTCWELGIKLFYIQYHFSHHDCEVVLLARGLLFLRTSLLALGLSVILCPREAPESMTITVIGLKL